MNMSYCRFHNTFIDLQDCVEALESFDDISQDEMRYAGQMYELCQRYMRAFEEFEEEVTSRETEE